MSIEIKNLTKKYKDVTAVDDLTLTIKDGELFSLLGVNGAGKTTTIKMLCCLEAPTAGSATLNGFDIAKQPKSVKSIINVSPQETAVAQNLTVKENLELIAGLHGATRKESREKAEEIMKDFELMKIANKKAAKLSGGWQRRLSIAMSLITNPQILFLDEPTVGLDVIARHEIWGCIEKLKGKMTVILTTHYLEEAESLSDRITIMKNGKLIATGTASELTAKADAKNLEDAFVKLASNGGNM